MQYSILTKKKYYLHFPMFVLDEMSVAKYVRKPSSIESCSNSLAGVSIPMPNHSLIPNL